MIAEASFFSKVLTILTTGLVAIPGGFLFSLLHIPLPWMLGPIFSTTAAVLIGFSAPLFLRRRFRR